MTPRRPRRCDPRRLVLSLLPRRLGFALRYMAHHKRFSLLVFPRRFSEKLALRLALDRRPLLREIADKMAMRSYIAGKVGETYLPRLLWASRDPDTLPYDALPERFVLKASHGSRFVHVVTDKSHASREHLISLCRGWQSVDYGVWSSEWAHVGLEPTLMIEEFLEGHDTGSMGIPYDYKFFVFDGKCAMIQVDVDRFTDHRRNLYDPDWSTIDSLLKFPRSAQPIAKPAPLDEMLALAERLGADIDFVRVDLYATTRGVIAGELTMTPGSGTERFSDPTLETYLGDRWKQTLP